METISRRQAQPSYTLFAAVIGGGSLLVSFAIAAIAWRMADAPKAVATEEKPRIEAKAPEVKPAAKPIAELKLPPEQPMPEFDTKAFVKAAGEQFNSLVKLGDYEDAHMRKIIAEKHAIKIASLGNLLPQFESSYYAVKSNGPKFVDPATLDRAYTFAPTSVSLLMIGTPASHNSAQDIEEMAPFIQRWLLAPQKLDSIERYTDPDKHVDLSVSRELYIKFKPPAVSTYRRMFLAGWRYYLISLAIKDGHGIDGFDWVRLRGKNIRPKNFDQEVQSFVFFHVIRGILPEARRERFDRCVPAILNENPVQFITSIACKSLE